MAQVVHISASDSSPLVDYANLTDVRLRSSTEAANGIYIAESSKVILRALNAGHRARSILLQEQWLDDVLEALEDTDVLVYVAPATLIESVTGYNVHRGALAVMERPEPVALETVLKGAKLVLILEDIVDHTNVGAMFRAAAGLGADAVLVTPRCADPLYRRSVRVSMGTVFQLPWARLPEWGEASKVLHENGFKIAALALSDSAMDLRSFAFDAPDKVALLMGAEGDGLSREALGHADTIVTIPMRHGVDSLNVASAAAVALFALGC